MAKASSPALLKLVSQLDQQALEVAILCASIDRQTFRIAAQRAELDGMPYSLACTARHAETLRKN